MSSTDRCPHTQLRFLLTGKEIKAHAAALAASLEAAADDVEKGDATDALAAWTAATDRVAAEAAECCLPALVREGGPKTGLAEHQKIKAFEDLAPRDAGAFAKTKLIDAFGAAYSRPGLYAKIKAAPAASDDETRAKAAHLARFEANGLAVADPVDRADVATLRRELGRQTANFERAINADATTVAMTRAELAGVPAAVVDALPTADGGATLRLGLKAPTLTPVLQHATDPAARRKAYVAAASRCAPNCGRLNRFVQLRASVAEKRGLESHAAAALAGNVLATPGAVAAFLDRVAARLAPLRDADVAELLERKRREHPGAASLDPWDTAYYGRQVREEKGIDEESLKPHFPAAKVVPAALRALGEDLFGYVVTGPLEDARLWHADCELYAVARRDGGVVGHVALDLKSRDGKFGHQMVVPLRPALPGGAPNCCAVLGNLGDAAGFLRFREVETLLHELGHVFHALAGAPKPSILGWAWPMVAWPGGVEMDFLEVPSMLTQQFAYAPAMLAKLAQPHATTGAPLPEATVAAIKANRHLLAGLGNAKYLAMCRYDLAMHQLTEREALRKDIADLWPPIYRAAAGFAEAPRTHFASTWYHMAIGYDAGYYSYLWSEVCAVDAYARFADKLDAAEGARLRELVLEPGAAKDGGAMMEAFLGRAVSEDAYFARLGA